MSKDRFTAQPYHRMSIQEKQAHAMGSAREPAVACPNCDTQVMPVDLLPHIETRCAGPRDPGPGAKWISWREAMQLSVPGKTFARWVERGQVRFLGERQDRRYLMRDVAMKIAQRRGFRRR